MAKNRKSFLDEWLGKGWKENPQKAVDKLSRYALRNIDKWDKEDFDRLLEEMRDFSVHRQKLVDNAAGEVGYDVWADAYWAMWKVDPELRSQGQMRPSHVINRFVMEEAMQLTEFEELRQWTVGDDVGAALACNTIEPDLETLYDKLEKEQEQAQKLQQMLQQLAKAQHEQRENDEIWKDWVDSEEAGELTEDEMEEREAQQAAQQAQMEAQIQAMIDALQQAGDELADDLDAARPGVRGAMRSAMKKAADEQQQMSDSADAWGLDPGQLQRMDHKQRLEMAKRLNTAKFRKIAELFGPMKRMAFTEQRRKVDYVPEEIFDIGMGRDLARVLPSELMLLNDPVRSLKFFQDYIEGRLMQYEMRGYEKVAKGGIICCMDGSGSMGGDREVWAKAVGLCLLHIAKKQKRPFYGIQFGSSYEIREFDFDTVKTGEIDTQMVIDFAEFFFNGGTDFMRPLSISLDRMRAEHSKEGRVKGDIVFITDGECMVHDNWLKEFKEEQKRLGFTVWGIIIGAPHREGDTLDQIADGKVMSIKQLTSGDDIREVFARMGKS